MPRNATAAYVAALESPGIYPALFVSINFASGPVNAWSGYQPAILAGVVCTGVGNLLSVSTIEDGCDVYARGISVTLSGIDPTFLPAALNDFQVGLNATVTLGLQNGEGLLLINEPVVAWSGRTDQPTISVGPETATLTINLESILLDMNVALAFRYTQVDQQLFFPGDQGFSLVTAIQSSPIYWNQNSNSDGNP